MKRTALHRRRVALAVIAGAVTAWATSWVLRMPQMTQIGKITQTSQIIQTIKTPFARDQPVPQLERAPGARDNYYNEAVAALKGSAGDSDHMPVTSFFPTSQTGVALGRFVALSRFGPPIPGAEILRAQSEDELSQNPRQTVATIRAVLESLPSRFARERNLLIQYTSKLSESGEAMVEARDLLRDVMQTTTGAEPALALLAFYRVEKDPANRTAALRAALDAQKDAGMREAMMVYAKAAGEASGEVQ